MYDPDGFNSSLKLIVVGGSHASHLAAGMDDMKLDMVDLSTPSWSLTEAKVEKLAATLEGVVNEETEHKMVIVYHLFDNNIFYGLKSDNSKVPPFRGRDGKYHIEGALQIADRPTLRDLYNTAVPLLRAGGEECKIIISPLLRYIGGKCCDNPAHITNLGDKRYFQRLGICLGEITDWLKECGHSKRIRNYRVMCPNRMLRMEEDDNKAAKRVRTYWDADPVHMGPEGYRQLACAMLEKVAAVANTAPEPQQPGPTGTARGCARCGWTDDAVARRSDSYPTHRGGHSAHLDRWQRPRGWAAFRGAHGATCGHGGRFRGHGGLKFRPY
jgi:hypothetical protein